MLVFSTFVLAPLFPAFQTAAESPPRTSLAPLEEDGQQVLARVRRLGLAGQGFGVLPRGITLPSVELGVASLCEVTASIAARAAFRESQEDLLIAIANCLNTTDPLDLAQCLDDLWTEFSDAIREARQIYDARLEVCSLLGESLYDPDIDPADFLPRADYAVSGGNEYFPLVVGTTWVYEKEVGGEVERVTVTVEDGVRELLGVQCAVVRDTVEVFEPEGGEGSLVEDTYDYFAVDRDLKVWYFGEDTWELEDGLVVSVDGRWLAGDEYAKPGIVMHADPVVGTTFRQEFALDEAEDVGRYLAVGLEVEGPLGPFLDCRQTEDFTPLEPGAREYKFYAPGVGLVREEAPDDPDEVLELLEFFVE